MTKNYYKKLGLKKEDKPSQGDIKKAYKELALKWHPDR
jgi:DnaJ-class molecular chaperone